jgi:hypothetical protein
MYDANNFTASSSYNSRDLNYRTRITESLQYLHFNGIYILKEVLLTQN